MGVIYDRSWPRAYFNDFKTLSLTHYTTQIPKLPGTLAFILQHFRKRYLQKWIKEFSKQTSAQRIVIHCHNAWMSGVFLPLTDIKGIDQTFIATFHGVPARFKRQPLRHFLHTWMAKRLLKHRVRITSVDPFNPEIARALFRMPEAVFSIIPNGLADKQTPGKRYPTHRDFMRTGFVGNITAGKGWEIACEAVKRLSESGKDIRLTLAGKGADERQVYDWASAYPKQIEYLGYVQDPVKNLMPDIDVLVVMSDSEGLPMAIIESLSAAVPVVATAVGGIPTAVEHGKTGFLVSRTVEALKEALAKLYDNPDLLHEFSVRAHELFTEKFRIDRIEEQYAEVYGLADLNK
jgi:glycosyltransferase involved in cell wall biosynthesis